MRVTKWGEVKFHETDRADGVLIYEDRRGYENRIHVHEGTGYLVSWWADTDGRGSTEWVAGQTHTFPVSAVLEALSKDSLKREKERDLKYDAV